MRYLSPYIACLMLMTAGLLPAANPPPQPPLLQVNTTPDDAVISCNGIRKGSSPIAVQDLKPGDYVITASKPGHKTARKSVTLAAGQRTVADLKLIQDTGLVIVHSQPSDAEIKINGAFKGKTPMLITDLTMGKHRMVVSLAGFQSKEIELNVADRTPQKQDVVLTSDSATLIIDSTPGGAEVEINGLSRGKTPCTAERVPAGEAKIQVTLAGCEPFQQTIKVSPGQTETINATLKVVPGILEVESIPPKARIYLDDEFRGEAPLKIPDLKPGAHRVRAELRGYEPMARDVTMHRAQTAREEFRLTRNSGTLEITTEPAGIKVTVDGEALGTTKAPAAGSDAISEPLKIDLLTVGTHKVQLSQIGYASKNVTIEVEKDKSVILHEKLKRMWIPNYRVRTRAATYEGMLQGTEPNGDILIETRPGIVKKVPGSDVISQGFIRKEEDATPKPDAPK